MKKLYLFFILVFLVIPFVSPKGIVIVGNGDFVVNKTYGTDETIFFQIQNQEPFTFYNVTFEDNSFVEMTKISEINSGETKNVTAIIKADQNLNQVIKIIGYYVSEVGQSNLNYEVDINDNSISPCLLSIVEGDSVVWNNFINDEVKLINSETFIEITTIQKSSSYTSLFDTPLNLNYYITRRGFQIPLGNPQDCIVTAIDDFGIVHDPLLDTSINLNVVLNYESTTMSSTFLQTSYILDVYESDDGIFSIKNIGDKTAKNIFITGDWFVDISPNNFDLEVGKTKSVSYTLIPFVEFTNDTNEWYNKTLSIQGNFETINQNFEVFVNYADLGGNYSGSSLAWNEDIIKAVIDSWCNKYPEDDACKPKIIYKYSNNSQGSNQSMIDQLVGLFSFMIERESDREEDFKIEKQMLDLVISNVNYSSYLQNETGRRLDRLEKEKDLTNSTLIFLVSVIIIMIGGFVSYNIIMDYKKRRDLQSYKGMFSGIFKRKTK